MEAHNSPSDCQTPWTRAERFDVDLVVRRRWLPVWQAIRSYHSIDFGFREAISRGWRRRRVIWLLIARRMANLTTIEILNG